MGVRTVNVSQTLKQDTNRGPSRSIWGTCPVEDILQDPHVGMHFYEEFDDFPSGGLTTNAEGRAGKWSTFLDTNGVVGTGADTTNLPEEGSVLGITAGTNNNLNVTMAANQSSYRMISPATGNPLTTKLWFECSIAVSTVASGAFDMFVGLMDTGDGGTRITSAANLVFSAANTIKTAAGNGGCIGFWKRATTNPSDVAVVYNVNNGTAQNPAGTPSLQTLSLSYAGQAMAALSTTSNIPKPIDDPSGACFIKLGFVFDPSAYVKAVASAVGSQTAGTAVRPLVQFYVNGQPASVFLSSTEVQAATFPSTFMAPVIGFRTGGTGTGIAYVDFVRAAQPANS